jgi:hypothetical protein
MPTRRPTDPPADPAARPEVARPAARAKRSPALPRPAVSPEARRAMIAQNAYLRAERRGFEPGHEEEDWLAAESEVDALLKIDHGGSPQ